MKRPENYRELAALTTVLIIAFVALNCLSSCVVGRAEPPHKAGAEPICVLSPEDYTLPAVVPEAYRKSPVVYRSGHKAGWEQFASGARVWGKAQGDRTGWRFNASVPEGKPEAWRAGYFRGTKDAMTKLFAKAGFPVENK